jgi:hypothetical protein
VWDVVIVVKEISTGEELLREPAKSFQQRNDAESYIFAASSDLKDRKKYVAAILSHPVYGTFFSDPTYWDFINMSKRIVG